MSERYVVVIHGDVEELRGMPAKDGHCTMHPFTGADEAARGTAPYVENPAFGASDGSSHNRTEQVRTIYKLVPVKTITVRKRAVVEVEETTIEEVGIEEVLNAGSAR